MRMCITHPLVDELARHDPRLEALAVPYELDCHFFPRVVIQRKLHKPRRSPAVISKATIRRVSAESIAWQYAAVQATKIRRMPVHRLRVQCSKGMATTWMNSEGGRGGGPVQV